MPVFEDDTYDLQDYYEQQLRHYGLNKTLAPAYVRPATLNDPSDPLSELEYNMATGMPAPRTPSPALYSPPATIPAGTRVIQVGPDGRYDPESIRPGSRARRISQAPPSLRPDSSLSEKKPVERTDTTDSKSSWRSRRDSAGQYVRRLSISFKEKAEIVSMDRNERVMYVRAKNAFAADDDDDATKSRPGSSGSITRGEQIALGLSKAVDPFKRGRSNTNDSTMSMGMTDTAPDDQAMQACKRCFRPTHDYLIEGECVQCHKETKGKKKADKGVWSLSSPVKDASADTAQDTDLQADFVDPWQFPQGRHTYPESPEHGFMKLPNRKMVRIRQTIYESPGNPFANDTELAEQVSRLDFGDGSNIPPHGGTTQRPASLSKPANLPSAEGPRPFLYRRSMSVALPPSKSLLTENDEYVPARAHWRKGSMSANHLPEAQRDTKFYGFYDDIWRDYKVGGEKSA